MTIQVVQNLPLTVIWSCVFVWGPFTKTQLSHQCQQDVWSKLLGHPVELAPKGNVELHDSVAEGQKRVRSDVTQSLFLSPSRLTTSCVTRKWNGVVLGLLAFAAEVSYEVTWEEFPLARRILRGDTSGCSPVFVDTKAKLRLSISIAFKYNYCV